MPAIRLRPFWNPLMLVAALALAPAAHAQKPLEEQMTPAQFKAAGLDKLTPQELATLNAWLQGALESEGSKVAALTQDRFETQHRGFLSFGKNDPIDAHIAGDFRGFGKGLIWTLDNGQQWEQTDSASLVGVRRTDPKVRITPSIAGNHWYLQIEGYNTRATVRRVK